jgi:hypothetical protein
VPIEKVWNLLNESQKGLSGVEAHDYPLQGQDRGGCRYQ